MKKKIAIVYDWIDKWGGVERLLLHLHEMYPEAHFYTSYYDAEKAPWAKDLDIRTSFIQRLPSVIRRNRYLSFLLYPFAFESFDFSEYDVVLSVTSSFAKGIITKPHTKHISYMLTPPRYLWGMTEVYLPGWKQAIAEPFLKKMREWDFIAAQRPDKIVTLSNHVVQRIKTYYKRESEVVYPPFDRDYWNNLTKKGVPGLPDSYYLIVSRLEAYKRIDLALSAVKEKSLVIVGDGTLIHSLKGRASANVLFYTDCTDEELAYLYSHAQALIMPQEEDFGYVSLEAQSCGCPVITYARSGATETVEPETSVVFERQETVSLEAALARYEDLSYNIRSNLNKMKFKKGEQFDARHFEKKIRDYLED